MSTKSIDIIKTMSIAFSGTGRLTGWASRLLARTSQGRSVSGLIYQRRDWDSISESNCHWDIVADSVDLDGK